MPRPSFSRHFSRSKPPTKRDAERRAQALLLNTRSLSLVPPEKLVDLFHLPPAKAQALWDAEEKRRDA